MIAGGAAAIAVASTSARGERLAEIRVAAERVVAAAPERVRSLLQDYARRPEILTEHTSGFGIEEGGSGPGTVFRYHFHMAGRERDYRMRAEDRRGVLVERDLDSSLVTSWWLTPSGDATRVRVQTAWQGASGVGGLMERTFAPVGLRRDHAATLDRLAAAVESGG